MCVCVGLVFANCEINSSNDNGGEGAAAGVALFVVAVLGIVFFTLFTVAEMIRAHTHTHKSTY